MNVSNAKALFRALKAFYGLGEHKSALIKLQMHAKAATNNDGAVQEFLSVEDRLEGGQSGFYGWNVMRMEAKKSATSRLDHTSCVVPVRAMNVSNERDRGLVVT